MRYNIGNYVGNGEVLIEPKPRIINSSSGQYSPEKVEDFLFEYFSAYSFDFDGPVGCFLIQVAGIEPETNEHCFGGFIFAQNADTIASKMPSPPEPVAKFLFALEPRYGKPKILIEPLDAASQYPSDYASPPMDTMKFAQDSLRDFENAAERSDWKKLITLEQILVPCFSILLPDQGFLVLAQLSIAHGNTWQQTPGDPRDFFLRNPTGEAAQSIFLQGFYYLAADRYLVKHGARMNDCETARQWIEDAEGERNVLHLLQTTLAENIKATINSIDPIVRKYLAPFIDEFRQGKDLIHAQ